MRFLWAAYKLGDFGDMPKDLDRDAFQYVLASYIDAIQNVFLSIAREPFKGSEEKPLGMVIAGERQEVIEPHVFWFPWATPRNRLEAALGFLDGLRRQGKIALITTRRDDAAENFHNRICRYGVCRFVGVLKGYFKGDDGALFQTIPIEGKNGQGVQEKS